MKSRHVDMSVAGRASRIVLYVLLVVSVALFVVVHATGGGDVPVYDEYSAASAAIDVYLWYVAAMIAVAVVSVAVSGILRLGNVDVASATRNGVNGRAIALVTALSTVALVVLSFVLSPSDAMETGAEVGDDGLATKAAGAAVVSCTVLLAVAACAVVAAAVRRVVIRRS